MGDGMKTKVVTYQKAADLLVEWGDRRLPAKPDSGPIDFSLEDACDGLCRWLADDPERSLDAVPPALLRHLRIRLLFAVAACVTRKAEIIGTVPIAAPKALVLAGIIGIQLAQTRLPPEWRIQ